jgi:probable rRNA maturation factor
MPARALAKADKCSSPFNFLEDYSLAVSKAPSSLRLFSSSKSADDGKFIKPAMGRITLLNEQTSLQHLDIDRFRATLKAIRRCIGYESYGVTLILVDDEEMQQTNLESRSINAPTDILSFPFHPAIEPGTLEPLEPPFDKIPDYYMLGDLLVDVPYVQRGCRDDEQDSQQQDDIDNDDIEEYEEEEEERGVSGAMANVFDPEERIHMLLVHGMLHLVGHDHETDEDYERMVTKEEEILQQLGLPNIRKTDMER